MKHLIRSYSIGLLTAAIVFGFTYWQTNTEKTTTPNDPEPLHNDAMISQLENDGFHVLTEEEWKNVNSANEKQAQIDEGENNGLTTFSIDIVAGTNTTEISQKLEQAHIIEDAQAFETFMKENEYSRFIQIGQVTLNSSMDNQEIAEVMTSK